MKTIILKIFIILSCIGLLFTSCTSAGIPDKKSTDSEYSQEVQNLEKLCKVWGYTKYTHPAFLLGERDWDEELLKLIPVVSEAKAKKVNDILHEWFVSLGEIDYGTSRKISHLLYSPSTMPLDSLLLPHYSELLLPSNLEHSIHSKSHIKIRQ